MNNVRPGFCTQCRAPIDPEDDSRECAGCTDDIIDNDEPPDEDYPEFDWRNSAYVKTPSSDPTAVRVLTLSEIESLQQNKRETTERLMALIGSTVRII